jgi:hypothetical protein
VDKAVRELVRPALKDVGFHRFAGRSAWRQHDQTVDLVVCRSFNSYVALGVGCTTFSFAVSAGVFYQCTAAADNPRPKDYELTFRFELGKSLRQPYFHPYGGDETSDRPDVWYVLPDGSNLVECVNDARQAITTEGLPLIDRFTQAPHAYHALLTETSRNVEFAGVGIMMPGGPDSSVWRDTTLAIGHLVTDDPRRDMQNAPVLARVQSH